MMWAELGLLLFTNVGGPIVVNMGGTVDIIK